MPVSHRKRRLISMLPLSRKMRRLVQLAVVVVIIALALADRLGCQTARLESDRSRYDEKTFTVVHVVDGDTLDLEYPDPTTGKATTRVRLWGVDSPEVAHTPNRGQDARDTLAGGEMYYGAEASVLAKQLTEGRVVRVRLEPYEHTRGKYGRLLAYIYLPDGAMLNEELLRQGCAYADERFEHVYMQRFIDLQKQAQRDKVGLWRNVKLEQTPAWYQRRHKK